MKEEDNQFIMNILTDENKRVQTGMHRIVVAGTGYVGLSLAVLLYQYNQVTAVDIIPEKVEKLNNYISPIQDEYIERYLSEAKAGKRTLNLNATTEAYTAYADADFIIIAAPTNYDPRTNYFDCSAVESVIQLILDTTAEREIKPTIVIKSTVPVGFTESVRKSIMQIISYSRRNSYANRKRCMTISIPAGSLSDVRKEQRSQRVYLQICFDKVL